MPYQHQLASRNRCVLAGGCMPFECCQIYVIDWMEFCIPFLLPYDYITSSLSELAIGYSLKLQSVLCQLRICMIICMYLFICVCMSAHRRFGVVHMCAFFAHMYAHMRTYIRTIMKQVILQMH